MKRWTVILAAALIFASGVVTGALAFRVATERQHAREPGRREGPPSPVDMRFHALRSMQDDLGLTPEQTNRIDQILQEGRKHMHSVWESTCQPRIREEMEKVHRRILAELEPEQRVRFEEVTLRFKEKWHRRNGDRHPRAEEDRGPEEGARDHRGPEGRTPPDKFRPPPAP